MAWRSSGTTNDEMVDKLKHFGVISTPAVEDAFRQVDRAFFVPPNQKDIAHADQPLREGNIHISAPHIYGSVLEALELKPNSSLSFLNVGSGTGYLSCIVATILGCHSNNYGIEIHKDVVEHSRASMARWKVSVHKNVPDIEWIHGNALHINPKKGESIVGFDRIYVGASVEKESVSKLTCLLRPGGILIGPVEDELVKIVRVGMRTRRTDSTSSLMMETENPSQASSSEFSQQILSGVRFAPLLENPRIPSVLPSKIWDPSVHHNYPDSFRNSCREILLCSHASRVQGPPPIEPKETLNAACLLPRVLWMEVLSYTHRDWFEKPESETEFLRRRLKEEQEYAQRAHQARLEAEARLHLAEEERDVYRVLARRYQTRLETALERTRRTRRRGNNNENNDEEQESDEESEMMVPLNGREQAVVFGLGAMLRSMRYESGNDDDDDGEEEEEDVVVDDDIDTEGDAQSHGAAAMEEDSSHGDHEESMLESNSNNEAESSTYFPLVPDAMSLSHSGDVVVRPQARTVSITSGDL